MKNEIKYCLGIKLSSKGNDKTLRTMVFFVGVGGDDGNGGPIGDLHGTNANAPFLDSKFLCMSIFCTLNLFCKYSFAYLVLLFDKTI